ncbi:MAG TPA: hypothetical protein VNG12_00135 [Acidimicrobiales bacterium]|nr:hypothetical protein [Acidimicrobiales bacterium]
MTPSPPSSHSNEDNDPFIFFTQKRGISEDIWRARPYVWWTPDDLEPATAPFRGLSKRQQKFIKRSVRQGPGWVITRYPALDGLPPIYPELRPIDPVMTDPGRKHWHGDREMPKDVKLRWRLPGTRETWKPHINAGLDENGDVKEKVEPEDHCGINAEDVHQHPHRGKYLLPPSRKIEVRRPHDHPLKPRKKSEARWKEDTSDHIAKAHRGVDATGPHDHVYWEKDPTEDGLARRLDVHPWAWDDIRESDIIFFVIEGCIKADAVLADGGAVFSVPSVTLWDCPELPVFAARYLLGKKVFIVADADWHDNDKVINQAELCRAQLRRFGVSETYVAAPPPTCDGKKTKGVDDFIGAGGHIEDLLVIASDPPEAAIRSFLARRYIRIDRLRRDTELLVNLACFTSQTNGILRAPLTTVARVLGIPTRTVQRTVEQLEKTGALTRDTDLAIKTDYFSRQPVWKKQTSITLLSELRAIERPQVRLADLIPIQRQYPGDAHGA